MTVSTSDERHRPPDSAGDFARLFVPHDDSVDGSVLLPLVLPLAEGRGGLLRSARHVVRRELTIAELHLPGTRRRASVQRLAPPGGEGARLRSALRRLVAGGLLVTRKGHGASRIETVIEAARVTSTGEPIMVAGGGALQPVATADGAPAILRIGFSDRAGDPSRGHQGLERVAGLLPVDVPTPMRHGHTGDVAWTLESRLPGRPGTVLRARDLGVVVRAWRQMPVSTGDPAAATLRHLDVIEGLVRDATHQPVRALASMRELTTALTSGPTTLAHGDLWHGNLLFGHDTLRGVIDWDAWSDDAPAGIDLLQLFATGLRRRRGLSLGEVWLRRPWSYAGFREAVDPYFGSFGLTPDERHLEALGLAWWAREIAGTLTRYPERREDPRWIADNVYPVVSAMDVSPPD